MIIVKVGGGTSLNIDAVVADIVALRASGTELLLVHGGAQTTNAVAEALGHPAQFVTSETGHVSRRTDRRTLEIFEMVYCGQLNKMWVEKLQTRGINAVGLSGLDGRVFEGTRKDTLRIRVDGRRMVLRDDWTGTVEKVNVELLKLLIGAGYFPVLTPPGASTAGEAINVDGDRAAAMVAGAFNAEALVILTDQVGLLEKFPDESTLISAIPKGQADRFMEFAEGRMKKKVMGAVEAIDEGVGKVIFADGRVEEPITRALAGAGLTLAKKQADRPTGQQASRKTLTNAEAEELILGGTTARRGDAVITRGEGCWLWDEAGNKYLDLGSAQGVAMLGHCHPGVTAAIQAQAETLTLCPSYLYNDKRAEFAKALADVLPKHLGNVFLANSGAEAMDGALKFARLFTKRAAFVAATKGFHGRTMGALSVTWEPKYREGFGPLFETTHVQFNDAAALDKAVTDKTAAVVLEVVQGESGVNVGTPDFLKMAQRVCKDRGALLIVDEIQTGFGRTGKWFAIEHAGIEPDIMCLAKGLGGGFPMGALAYTKAVRDVLTPGAHGSTFGGSPLACAAGLAAIEAYRDEDLIKRSATLGADMRNQLRGALEGVAMVREIRVLGLMIAVELRTKVAPVLKSLMLNYGVIALPAGPTVLRLLPPLIITEKEINTGVQAIAKAIKELKG